ncbi:MAG: hypothetical protein HQL13_01105 [Candidatus Omnitrophica bacterium]|nr:hypothetical protein [Candidatus Omnitrophota bacterium]
MTQENPQPLDVNQFKRLVQQESVRLNLRSLSTKEESTFTLALALVAAVKKIFFEKTKTTFSNEPSLHKKSVVKFVNRMRVDAMEKFNSTTVFSVVQLAQDEEKLTNKDILVTLVVYMEQKFLPEFLRLLQYPYIDFDDDMEVKDGCGTVINLIAGQFKKEMVNLGYKDFMMSHFESFINTAPDGVQVPTAAMDKYEVSFQIEGVRRLFAEIMIVNDLPKKSKA